MRHDEDAKPDGIDPAPDHVVAAAPRVRYAGNLYMCTVNRYTNTTIALPCAPHRHPPHPQARPATSAIALKKPRFTAWCKHISTRTSRLSILRPAAQAYPRL